MVAAVRRQVGTRAVGHAGTLDPFATGLLVVLIGRATRLARFVESEAKAYDAVIHFGTATETDDGTGAPTATVLPAEWPDASVVQEALAAMVGTHAQRPPAYSAKHVGGARSYALARAGRAVELASVPVTIHEASLRGWTPPDARVTLRVGKGTYVRAIARDLGEALGIPAHCAELRRTAIGPFTVDQAVSPAEVTGDAVRPAAEMVRHLPRVVLDAAGCREVSFGRAVAREAEMEGPAALLAEDGRLVAIAEAAEARWQPVVVLEPAA